MPREQTERERERERRANVRGTRKNEEGREGGSGRRPRWPGGRADPNDEGNAEKEREREDEMKEGRKEGGREGGQGDHDK